MPKQRKKKARLRFKTWDLVERALDEGLGFALNRLEDTGVKMTPEQREAALPYMLNELQLALEGVIDWERSG